MSRSLVKLLYATTLIAVGAVIGVCTTGQATVPPGTRWTINEVQSTGNTHRASDVHVFLVNDPDTGVDYVVVRDGDALAITPRLMNTP